MVHVNATVTRDGRWWLVSVPEFDIVGQAARLNEAEEVAKEITALWLDIPEEDVSATVTPVLDKALSECLVEAAKKDETARTLTASAAQQRRMVVHSLLETGMKQTEAATLMGVTRQRIAQLAAD